LDYRIAPAKCYSGDFAVLRRAAPGGSVRFPSQDSSQSRNKCPPSPELTRWTGVLPEREWSYRLNETGCKELGGMPWPGLKD
jgi:hypothetical protein